MAPLWVLGTHRLRVVAPNRRVAVVLRARLSVRLRGAWRFAPWQLFPITSTTWVAGYAVTDTRDAGASKHAAGESVLDEAGVPVAHGISKGDAEVKDGEKEIDPAPESAIPHDHGKCPTEPAATFPPAGKFLGVVSGASPGRGATPVLGAVHDARRRASKKSTPMVSKIV